MASCLNIVRVVYFLIIQIVSLQSWKAVTSEAVERWDMKNCFKCDEN